MLSAVVYIVLGAAAAAAGVVMFLGIQDGVGLLRYGNGCCTGCPVVNNNTKASSVADGGISRREFEMESEEPEEPDKFSTALATHCGWFVGSSLFTSLLLHLYFKSFCSLSLFTCLFHFLC